MKPNRKIFLALPGLLTLLAGCGGGSGSTASTPTTPAPGAIPLLVVALQYADRSFVNPATVWHDRMFGGGTGTLNDYYAEVSGGAFAYTAAAETQGSSDDGIITVTLPTNHPDPSVANLTAIQPDLKAALETAENQIDFAAYDSNGNGALEPNEFQVIFIVAGYEDAYNGGTQAPGVWAHSDCTASLNTPVVDGVRLMGCADGAGYSLFGERHYDPTDGYSEHDATIGVIAHELGHASFDLPDLYDTDSSNGDSAGIGLFGLMAYGSWAQASATDYPGNTPTHLSAWSKSAVGWYVPQSYSGVSQAAVALNATSSASYNIVKVPIDADEYFLLENRDNSGYDRGFYSLAGTFDGGMAIWHVDESVIRSKSSSNTVNGDETHKGVDLEEAALAQLDSGSFGYARNLFYVGNATEFTPLTTPSSDDYTPTGTGIYIENISARGATMSAVVTNPN